MKRPRTVWLRVLLFTIAFKHDPQRYDGHWRGPAGNRNSCTWRAAFRFAAWSWGYKV